MAACQGRVQSPSGPNRAGQRRGTLQKSYSLGTEFFLFRSNFLVASDVNMARMQNGLFMKLMKPCGLLAFSALGAVVATGCVERRVEYVPAYQAQPAYTATPGYSYQPQTAYQAPPGQSADSNAAAVAPQPDNAPPPPPPNTVVVAQAPPTPQVEVVPVAPGPEYVWAPGYWSVGVGGGWVWIGGRYVIRPHPHAVWVGGHWGRRGRGYIWVGGHWR